MNGPAEPPPARPWAGYRWRPAPGPTGGPVPTRWLRSIVLFLLTLFTTTTLGAVFYLASRTDVTTDLVPFLGPRTVRAVWTDPELRAVGLAFSLPALFILLCHELGHYLVCRRRGLPATLPYFLPFPLGLGTLGAFIRIRSPIRNRRELLDVGAAGPLAGAVALVPFLLYGVAHSDPVAVELAANDAASAFTLYVPGKCLAIRLASRLFHGPLPPGHVLQLHPFALAAWLGLLATALNLLPLGQLDGGHVLYAAACRLQRRLALPLWIALGLVSLRWPSWLLLFALVLVLGFRHPPVQDEEEGLDPKRQVIALLCLALLVLAFIPEPVRLLPVAP